jgi:hypothetical protein
MYALAAVRWSRAERVGDHHSYRIMTSRLGAGLAGAVAVVLVHLPADAGAQSLRGSSASISRMYRHAKAEHLPFYRTASAIHAAARKDRLVALEPDSNFTVFRVKYPLVQPQTRTFVRRLAAQYRDACGEQLVVTSAVRPTTRQPWNSTRRSVHPTGMAVDLRKPSGACLGWMRRTLLELEDAGVLEATEEFGPPHFHVAVYPSAYGRYAASRVRAERRLATREASTTYEVRPGDTLWEIAREHDTSVADLSAANQLDGNVIVPGQTLVIPR